MKSAEIRQQFLKFYEGKKHDIVPSAPMVIKNDPTLMFTNAGMNQFKEFFLGNGTPKNTRLTDSQKCLRVSGKHNDLEEVGIDTYHHTMFEMLGNWSFGEYFKKEAIAWAWELLTEVYGIDKDILYVTVFEGSKDADNLSLDTEAYDFWKEIIPEDRILMGNKKDNFWEMGEQGPCGPCSEIHVDIRSEEEKALVSGADLVNEDHPLVVEIWNLVFMQYNRKANGSLEKLKDQHVDTGMGFERLCMVLQDVKSNYDTDVFTPIISEIEKITNTKYNSDEQTTIAIRVIADHVRAVAFSIADGQLPSNTGAGYVIRRILRRAIRYGFTFLNTKEPFIYKLVETLSQEMGDAFPEIKAQKNLAANVIKEEEASFLRTLDKGLVLLDQVIKNNKGDIVSGKKAFELYDTYGFPIDLTALILSEKNLSLNEEEFQEELQKQKNRSRAASEMTTDDWTVLMAEEKDDFIGYDNLEADVKISRYRKVVSKKDGELYQLVFNLTPFYAEGGGQSGDKGYLEASNGDKVSIINTKKENNLIIHFTKKLPKDTEGTFKAVVSKNDRNLSMANHSATHLLHQALRAVLGEHVEQKGSQVNPKSLRFDFSHFSKVTSEELEAIESFVNARIAEALPLEEQRNIPYPKAIEQGATGLFGEKYGDTVRTICFGESMELCGGTHVQNTSDIWHFKLKSEGAVAAGIRRIEAITNQAASTYFNKQDQELNQVKSSLKNPKNVLKAIQSLQEDNSNLKKQIEDLLKEKSTAFKNTLKSKVQDMGDFNLLVAKTDLDAAQVKNIAFQLKAEVDNLLLVIGSSANNKPTLTVCIQDDLAKSKGYDAGKMVRELAKNIRGGGGGQACFATAGGKNIDGLDTALAQVKDLI